MKKSVPDSAELQFHIERIQVKKPLRPIIFVEILLYILTLLGALCMLLPVLPVPEALAGLQGLVAEAYFAAGAAFALIVLAMLVVTAITACVKKKNQGGWEADLQSAPAAPRSAGTVGPLADAIAIPEAPQPVESAQESGGQPGEPRG